MMTEGNIGTHGDKWQGNVPDLEGRDALQNDLERLESQACANLMKITRPSASCCIWVGAVPVMGTDWKKN